MATLSSSVGVKDSAGAYCARLISVYRRDTGAFVARTVSNATTGMWSVTTADTSEHFAIAHDGTATPGDAYWSSVVFASHFDDTALADLKGHAVTLNGTAARSSTQSKFGGYAAYFDGASYISCADSADWDFVNAGDFDLQLYFYSGALSNTAFIGQSNGGGAATPKWGLYLNDSTTVGAGNIGFHCNDGSAFNVAVAWAPSTNAWHLLHASRAGDNWYFIGDGTLIGTVSQTRRPSTSTSNLRIGSDGEAYRYFNGYIDDVLITKGQARATAGYSLPTSTFVEGAPTISGGSENAIIYDRLVPV